MYSRIQTCTWVDISVRRLWRPLMLAVVVAILYSSALAGLVRQWYYDANYSHGFLVPIFVGYLIWRKREVLSSLHSHPRLFGLFVVLGSLGVLFLGQIGADLFLRRISLLGTIVGIVLYFRGWATLRTLAFPLCFLLLMIPLPALIHNQIVFPLQLLASRLATMCLETVNIVPILREGNLLLLPNYTLQVVEACSGIRSLMSLVALGLGYGYLAEHNVVLRAVLVLAIVPMAIVSNGMRVVGTALLIHFRGTQTAEAFLHSFSGWLIFLVAVVLLLGLHAALASLGRVLHPGNRK